MCVCARLCIFIYNCEFYKIHLIRKVDEGWFRATAMVNRVKTFAQEFSRAPHASKLFKINICFHSFDRFYKHFMPACVCARALNAKQPVYV